MWYVDRSRILHVPMLFIWCQLAARERRMELDTWKIYLKGTYLMYFPSTCSTVYRYLSASMLFVEKTHAQEDIYRCKSFLRHSFWPLRKLSSSDAYHRHSVLTYRCYGKCEVRRSHFAVMTNHILILFPLFVFFGFCLCKFSGRSETWFFGIAFLTG